MNAAAHLAALVALFPTGCVNQQQQEQQVVTAHHAMIGQLLVGAAPPWCQVVVRDANRAGAVLYLALPGPEILDEIRDPSCTPQAILEIDRRASELAAEQGRRGFAIENRRAYAASRDGKVQAHAVEPPALPPVTVMVSTVRFTD